MTSTSRRRILAVSLALCCAVLLDWPGTGPVSWAQQTGTPPSTPQGATSLAGGQGFIWFSQFANPALLGSLYLTPNFPLTGYYPLYPGALTTIRTSDGVTAGPLKLHPSLGLAELYTDNVFRTASNRTSDFVHAMAPAIQVQLPMAFRHALIVDYRTNLLFFDRTPANDVRDQTASGRVKLDFPGGLKVDFQGEHKVGHDPRGSAQDLQFVEVNKWRTDSVTGRVEYTGVQASLALNLQSTRWNYTNNGLGPLYSRLNNYVGMTFSGAVTPKSSLLISTGVNQQIYDQNKNLDSNVYMISTGARWQVSDLTSGELLVGYQFLRFSKAQTNQPPPLLSQFTRSEDSASNFYVAGNLRWTPTSYLSVNLQPYRAIQQTVVLGSLFFVSTGANLAVTHSLSQRNGLNLNVGVEQDKFTSGGGVGASAPRSDTLKNIALGYTYKATRYLGATLQYAYEDRSSTDGQFVYNANTFTVGLQGGF